MIALAVILVLLAFVAFYAIAIYNKLVKLKNAKSELPVGAPHGRSVERDRCAIEETV